MKDLIPREIVAELDKYIVGQTKAKRMVAIALRSRWRRQRLPEDLRDEVFPKNIIMIGPTGVGKTEISRRLARLSGAPFLKVEASKYTEVGYVGRDVESMIRDLTEQAIRHVKAEHTATVQEQAARHAEERLLDLLLPPPAPIHPPGIYQEPQGAFEPQAAAHSPSYQATREKLRQQLRAGALDGRTVEVEAKEKGLPIGVVSNIGGMEELETQLREMFGQLMPGKKKRQRMTIPEALQFLIQDEAQKLVDMDVIIREAVQRVEQSGIIFIDELDKVAGRERGLGPDVSRQGVQRDLLPIIEGSTVTTKYGPVRTGHILFIAAGAFHVAKPSDLIPELQGRFPLRVELDSLGKEDFIRILTEPKNALIRQYVALLETEGIHLDVTPDAIDAIAVTTVQANAQMENIGARRLFTIMERLIETISFEAPEMQEKKVTIDARYVHEHLAEIVKNLDLSRYIL